MKKSFKRLATYLVPIFIICVVIVACVLFLLDNLPYTDDVLDVNLNQEKIVIDNTFVMNDAMGKMLSDDNENVGTNSYIEFEVTSTVDGKVKYEIYLSKEDAEPEISSKFVKVYLTDENDKAVTGFDVANIPTYYDLRVSDSNPSGRVLYSGVLKDKGSKKFRLRMWTSDTYEVTAETRMFSSILNVRVK